jgi:translation initiation factor IF-3
MMSCSRLLSHLPPRAASVARLASPSLLNLSRRASTAPPKKALNKSTQLKDEDIPHRIITLVDPASSSLLPPAALTDILLSLDRTRFSILLVDPAHDPPICKILDKKALYTAAKNKAVAKKLAASTAPSPSSPTAAPPKAPAGPPKEVHLTWGVTAHDLGHKLAKAKEFLAKGARVTVVLKDKKGAEAVGQQERKEVLEGVERALEGIGKLKKKPENKGGMVMMEFTRQA